MTNQLLSKSRSFLGKTAVAGLTFALLFLGTSERSFGQVNIAGGGTISENFDGMTATNTAALPSGWKMDKSTTVRLVGSYAAAVSATEQIGGINISATAGNGLYNFGLGAAGAGTERAIGGLSSSSASKSVNAYVDLFNNGPGTISDFTISYNVEKYRKGSNLAGFSIQMYYSTNGTSWTNAGANFLTSFAADADNLGYATVPGATTPVLLQSLIQAIPASGHLYLAWNYSVSSGTTTSNAQALGIDNVTITANAPASAPFVSSPTETLIGSTIATLGGDVTSDGGSALTASGVVWSETSINASPEIGGTGVTDVTGPGTLGVFTVNATGMPSSTQISYSAYASNANGTSYTTPTTFYTLSAGLLTPPTLTAASATVDANFDITYTDDLAWRTAVTSVMYGATTLSPGTDYSLAAGTLTLKPSGNVALQVPGTETVLVSATGYSDAGISQTIGVGADSYLEMNVEPTAPVLNGGNLATQPSVFIRDQYGNATASTATITANTGSGSWTPTGTITANGIAGTATFSGLGATSAAAVTGATIDFTSPGLTLVTSAPFNIPAPLLPADHIVFVAVPSTGITNTSLGSFTVQALRPDNSVDNTFADNITISVANGSGTLTGTLTKTAFSGIATFNDLQLDAADTYTLNANTGSFSQITSGSILIRPAIASWNFEGVTTTNTGTTVIISGGSDVADAGAQTGGSSFTAEHTSASTVWSNPGGSGSLKSVSSNNWSIGDYYQFLVNLNDYSDIFLNFNQLGSNTGPANFKVQYSTDGISYSDFASNTYTLANSSWHSLEFDLSSLTVLNGASTAYFRLVNTSTTSINGLTVGTGGTGRVDNVVLSGTCNVLCQNGGTVTVSCGCNCPSGFSGVHCEIVACTPPSAPTGLAAQSFCGAPTINDLAASGTALIWYDDASAGTAYSGTDPLVSGNHYYASQTVSGCESTSRLDVTATVTPYVVTNTTSGLSYCTIQSAINAAATLSGHTLQLLSGVTEGLVTINKDIIIDGNGFTLTSTSVNWGMYASVAGVSISNLTITAAGTFGIITNCGADNLALTNVTVTACGGSGIALAGSDNCVLTNITSTNNGGNGVSVTNCDNTTINGLTTSGNTFGVFGSGVGLFTSSTTCPPAGINGFALTGTISIAENPRVYSQKANAADVITGLSGSSISWAVGTSALDRSYWPDKATSYFVVKSLFEAPYNLPNTTLFVEEVATDNLYVDDNPAGDAVPPMLIQTGVNFAAAGKTVFVEAGSYAENLSINKALILSGANANNACGSRGAESVIAPASGPAVSITASGVTLNGFEITAPSATYGVVCGNTSNTNVIFNNIHNIGTTVTSGNVHAVNYTVANAAATSNVTVSDNCFNNISSTLLSGWSASAIGILQSPSTGVLTGLNIERNSINNVNVNTGNWPTGKIAYGMQINVGGNGSYMTTTGKVVNAMIKDNELSNISGFIATAIAMEGNTENAAVENNIVSNLFGRKLDVRAGGGYDLSGLKFENNRYSGTVTVRNNSFQTNTFSHDGTPNLGYAVSNYVPVANGGTATLECNWFGTALNSEIQDNVTLTGKIFNKDLCATSYAPYRADGTDGSPAVIGFQPSGACSAPCALAVSTSTTVATCPSQNDGTASVTVTGGGVGPYTYLWSNSATTDAISGLSAGTYNVTVTDINGCTATASATVTNSLAGPVHNTNTGLNYCTIQAAINDPLTLNGHLITVDAGTYVENVVVTKSLTIQGAGQANTFVIPAISDPNCGGAGGGSICAGGSYIFLIQANDVTLHDLTIDGDNTSLTSGIVAGGADLDARNGIITNHLLGVYQNLVVYNVTIQNIYLRGIYASSGGSFNFHDNTINNVQASTSSIGLFNFGGSGTFADNNVSNCNDGIASNWSTGTVFSGNTVSTSGSGIHTDNNGGSGGVADTIRNNTVQNSTLYGYGIWVFAPYRNVHVLNNTVNNVDVGIACAGQQVAVTPVFFENSIDGQNKVNSTGVYITTSLWGYGSSNNTVDFNNNYVVNNAGDGFYLESEAGQVLTLNAHNNSFTGNAPYALEYGVGAAGAGTFAVDMTCNWWGTNVPATVASTISGAITYIPYLHDGTDNSGNIGFQPLAVCSAPCALVLSGSSIDPTCPSFNDGTASVAVSSGGVGPYTYLWSTGATTATINGLSAGSYSVTVSDINGCTATTSVTVTNSLAGPVHNTNTGLNYCTIQAAINDPLTLNGHQITVDAGTYSGNITVNKSLTILGDAGNANPGPGVNAPVIDGGNAPGDAFLLSNGVTDVTIQGFEMRNFTSNAPGVGNGISAWEASTSNITIADNYFHNLGYNGVLVGNDGAPGNHNNWLITNNILETFEAYGFELTNASNSGIENNIIHSDLTSNPATCIMVDARRNESGITIKNNLIDGAFGTSIAPVFIFADDFETPNANLNNVLIENNLFSVSTQGTAPHIWVYNYAGTGTVTGVTIANNSLSKLKTNTPAVINAIDNYWGSANGPLHAKNVYNVGSQGGAITVSGSGSIPTFCPWWSGVSGVAGTLTGTSFAPITNNDAPIENYSNFTDALAGTTTGGIINAVSGTYDEDVNINKSIQLLGVGAASTSLRGVIGGDGATVRISASNVEVAGFAITRLGNNLTDWNNPALNSAGIAIQGAYSGTLVHDNNIFGNRTGIDVNNSSTHTFRNNTINDNRTGLIFRNVTDNLTIVENEIKENWTVGILFLDASSGTNVPLQTALNCTISNNDISGNWYGQIVDRQTGGSLPAPGANLKNFTCNWLGTTSPVITTASSAEPGYAAQIPLAYGGTAVAPGGQPDICGAASANIVYIPMLTAGTDANIETTPGRGTFGFQPAASCSAPCALAVSTSTTVATCPSQNDGTASVTVTGGGVGPYTYLWSNSATTDAISGLSAGTYNVTVTDINGCTATASATVTNSLAGPVHNTNTGLNYCTIQAAINDPLTLNGHLITVDAGTYVENVVVTKSLTIQGAGQANTFVIPAISDPNCGGAGGGSICAGGSYIFLIQANDVTLHDLTIDGDNTSLTSGIVAGGADLDARNGIITNHLLGVYQNLVVYNVTIQNIYLRGIYASSGGSFNFHDNTINNVQASTSSIGLFNFGGSGTFADNNVSNCNDGIASNWSTGTVFSGNTVSTSGSGIHTDNNGGSGGVADTIRNNTVQNSTLYGYGIWVFAPYRNVHVLNNTVNNVDVGIACAGQQVAVTPVFFENSIDGQNKVNSTGVYITTSIWGYGSSNNTVDFNNNYVVNNAGDGFYLESEAGQVLTLNAHNNSFTGNAPYALEYGVGAAGAGTFAVDMTCNWWGTNVPATVASTISGAITYIPYLHDGTDNSGNIGFQPLAVCSAPCALVLSGSSIDPTCPSFNDGTASVAVSSGGVGPYTYLWSTGATTDAISGLSAGTYSVTVSDINGCTATTSVTVTNSLAGPVHNTNTGLNYCTIQAAINDPLTLNGHLITVDAGTYVENVVVTKSLTIQGAGQANTFVIPAISDPNCGGAGGGSICAGGSYIFLIQANNVTLHDLTIDGDNTSLTSGIVAGGADLDARNGIITNHTLGVYQNLEVYNVTVQNIYLRGMYASSGGSFNFHDNTVNNVQATTSSIGLFNFGGSGTFADNNVSNCNDGIASNWSTGTVYSGNTVSTSGSGIHTDNNGGSGGVADTIRNNTVQNSTLYGYGIWVFAPYRNVHVLNNTVNNVDVGMACAGQQTAVTPVFFENSIDGQNKVNSTGVYITTSIWGYGSSNNTVDFNNNYVVNNAGDGFYLESEAGQVLTLNAHNNSFTGNAPYALEYGVGAAGAGTFAVDMTCNWWGTNVPATVASTISGAITYIPYLHDGTDNSGNIGFQPLAVCSAPCALVLSGSSIDPTCPSFNDGTASVAVSSGGVGPYTYLWSTGATTDAISGLSAGSYSVTVSDINGCTATTSVTVTNSLAGPVHNQMSGLNYCTIQLAINAASPGDVIIVSAGTYAENVSINKALTLNGANANNACGSRGTESVIAPASGPAVSITASGVTLNGFEITAPSATYGVVCGNTSNTNVIFNNIHDIGTTVTSGNVHAVNYTVANAAATSDVTISDNCFNNISSTLLSGWSASAIGVLQSPSTGVLTGLNIERNSINNVNVNTGNWPLGKIAYGMQINVGGNGSYMTTTGKVVNAMIKDNELSNISGFIATAIAMEGNTENAAVENNIVSNLFGRKLDVRAGGGYDLSGLKFENNRYSGTVTVRNNSFQTNTFSHDGTPNLGYAVSNYVPVANGGTATLECNWFGTALNSEIQDNVTLTGKVFNKDLCATSYVPYRTDGTDGSPAVIGFQPSGACSAPCALILSGSSTEATCPSLNDGTASVAVSSGGVGPYEYLWSNSATTDAINGLSPGTYTVTVSDVNGCTAAASITVSILSVTNVSTLTSYSTIQAAINAATAGDTIQVCDGTFNENLTINKALTLNGANANNACGSRGAESIIAPASGIAVSITASDVILNGFEITAPSANYGIVCGNTSNTNVIFNNIHDIGTTVTSGNVHALNYTVANAAATADVTFSDNCFNNISSTLLSGWSASAIGVLQSPSTGTLTGLNIERNSINNVNVNTGNWPLGKIAYGIQINVGGNGSYMTTTGKVVNAMIKDNELSNISGFIATAIGMEGNTQNAAVENNIVSNLSGRKLDVRAGGGYDLSALKFENNRYVGTVTVRENSFQTNTFSHDGTPNLGYAVSNYVPVANGGTATLECNWFGTAVYSEIQDNVTLTGKIFNKDLCATNFAPYLTIDTDGSPATIGFQPTGACSAPCAIVLSSSFTNPVCYGGSDGTATVSIVSGGVGPYAYSWSSGSTLATATGLAAGTYIVTVTGINGCVATRSVTLTNPAPLALTYSLTACNSVTLPWGQVVTTSGSYTHHYTAGNGCDLLATANVTIKLSTSSSQSVTACNSYTWNGVPHTTSGTYTTTGFINKAGCDSSATVVLTIVTSSSSSTSVTACDTYTWNGVEHTTSGTYTTLGFTNAAGCDSSATVVLTINYSSASSTSITACDSYTWNGVEHTTSGSYTTTGLITAAGCDSSATVELTINYSSTSSTSVTACDTYTWNGVEHTTSGSYTTTGLTNAVGCDSSATVELTINYSSTSSTSVTACDTYTWNGVEHTASGSYTSTGFTNAAGCDSSATVELTINYSTASSTPVTACDSYTWNSVVHTTSGTYTTTGLTNAAGCDSSATVELIINYSSTSSTSVTACDAYTWNGVEHTTSGSYTTTGLTNAAGCDSSATVELTINYSSTSSTSITACDTYTWNGVEHTTSGSYTTTGLTNAAGCDSSATVVLTINYSSTSSTSVTACDSYTWNSVVHTTSGTYTTTGLTNAASCDSSATVVLTINYSSTSSTSVTACDTYTWNSVIHTTSGSYTTTGLTNAAGCDSSATVVLTIKYSSTSSTLITACDSYTWNSVVHTTSGSYTTTGLTNAAGCDSSATVVLTINHSSASSETVSACGSYTWSANSMTYTTSGTYTYTGVNYSGCPHVFTLNLTITSLAVTATPSGSILCFGGMVNVNVSASGGALPYSGIGAFIQGDGTIIYTVTDFLGCSGSASLTLVQPSKVEGTTSTTPANCGSSTGTATVTAMGGSGSYSYLWTNSQTTAIATGLLAGTYSVTITDANGCTGAASATVVGAGILPDPAGAISGPSGACRNTCGIIYTVPPASGATSYTWTLPAGVSGSSTTNSITLCFDNTYDGGFICVTPVNSCGNGAQSCINIPVITVRPAQPGFIVGDPNPCGNTVHTYTLPPSANALSYTWTVSGSGVTILSGQGTNSVQVSFPTGFGQAVIGVYASNCIGTTSTRSTTLTGIPTHSSVLFGPGYVCAGTTGVAYSISSVIGAGTSYVWSTSGDMSVAGPQGSNSMTVNFGPTFTSGLLSVTTSSACGSYTKSYTLRSTPLQPGSIAGPSKNLCGLTGVTYSIPAIAGATGYNWTVPAGVNITANTGLSITVNFTPAFTGSGNICVSATNACGSSAVRCYAVTATPNATANITGAISVCKSASSVLYTVPTVAGATGYVWSITGGPSLTSVDTAATVNFTSATATSATLTVNATNFCGTSTPTRITIAVNLGCRAVSNENLSATDFNAYPNPTSGLMTVNFQANKSAKYTVKVTDLLGNVMISNVISASEGLNMQELNLSNVAKGMYLLSIQTEGENSQTLRVVVE